MKGYLLMQVAFFVNVQLILFVTLSKIPIFALKHKYYENIKI